MIGYYKAAPSLSRTGGNKSLHQSSRGTMWQRKTSSYCLKGCLSGEERTPPTSGYHIMRRGRFPGTTLTMTWCESARHEHVKVLCYSPTSGVIHLSGRTMSVLILLLCFSAFRNIAQYLPFPCLSPCCPSHSCHLSSPSPAFTPSHPSPLIFSILILLFPRWGSTLLLPMPFLSFL